MAKNSARRNAAASGEHIYHSGKACPRGHLDGRYTRTAGCVTCVKEAAKNERDSIARMLDASLERAERSA